LCGYVVYAEGSAQLIGERTQRKRSPPRLKYRLPLGLTAFPHNIHYRAFQRLRAHNPSQIRHRIREVPIQRLHQLSKSRLKEVYHTVKRQPTQDIEEKVLTVTFVKLFDHLGKLIHHWERSTCVGEARDHFPHVSLEIDDFLAKLLVFFLESFERLACVSEFGRYDPELGFGVS
jgi:hypothetical protein